MIILTADQQLRLTPLFEDRYGNAAPIDGMPRWEVSDETIATVTPDADGMSALVVTTGKVGGAQIRCVADAKVGIGVRELIGLEDISVVGGEARVVRLTAAPAEEKPGEVVPDVPLDEGTTPAQE